MNNWSSWARQFHFSQYVDDKSRERLAAFSFGKIKGYRGQAAEELGLRPGTPVTVEYDAQNRVSSVWIP